MPQDAQPAQGEAHSLVTARFLRMLSITLEQLDAVREANARAEFSGLRARVQALEDETDALERELEDACLNAFASGISGDELAFYLMVFRSLTNLERAGDYALKLAQGLEAFAPRVRSATMQDVLPIVQVLSQMLEHLSYAFAERDLQAAQQVMHLDYEQVDALYEQMQRASLTRLLERPDDTDVALMAGRLARSLERLGDHLVNVAERLEALILGRIPAPAGHQGSARVNHTNSD